MSAPDAILPTMQVPKTIYLIRHGQSEDNAAPVFQSYDSPLSDKGRQQATQLAERLKDIDFDTLIASPQLRAQQTAQAIAGATHKPIESNDLFIERFKPSSIDGRPYTYPGASECCRAWEESLVTPGSPKVEDGENYDTIVARADSALDFLRDHSGTSIVVVSHGHFIRTILARVLTGDSLDGTLLRQFYEVVLLENTGITLLKYQDAFEQDYRWRTWTVNDHAHIADQQL